MLSCLTVTLLLDQSLVDRPLTFKDMAALEGAFASDCMRFSVGDGTLFFEPEMFDDAAVAALEKLV